VLMFCLYTLWKTSSTAFKNQLVMEVNRIKHSIMPFNASKIWKVDKNIVMNSVREG